MGFTFDMLLRLELNGAHVYILIKLAFSLPSSSIQQLSVGNTHHEVLRVPLATQASHKVKPDVDLEFMKSCLLLFSSVFSISAHAFEPVSTFMGLWAFCFRRYLVRHGCGREPSHSVFDVLQASPHA